VSSQCRDSRGIASGQSLGATKMHNTMSSGTHACIACHSTGVKYVKAGKSARFHHKKLCRDAAAMNSAPPPAPRRAVQCDKCEGLGVLTTSLTSDAPIMEPAFTNRICVIGGGIGGLAFALASQHRGLDVTVYEKDASFTTRSQGYALTMQQGFTQLRKLGFSTDKLRDIGTVSTGHVTLDKDGTIIGRTGRDRWGAPCAKEAKRFNIQLPRQLLRYELLMSLPPDTVQWGKKLVSTSEDSKKLLFADGTTADYDILVDASGIWSQFVAPYELTYLGVIVILGRGRVVTKNDLNLGVDKIWQTVDGVTRMYAMPFGIEGETMWQLSWQCSEEEAKLLGGEAALLLAEAKRRVMGWHDPWTELLNSTSLDDVTGYPAYDRLPIPTFDDLPPAVVVLGDAAHPLSPFKGQGANQALADGVELATLLYTGVRTGVEGSTADESDAGVKRSVGSDSVDVLDAVHRFNLKRSGDGQRIYNEYESSRSVSETTPDVVDDAGDEQCIIRAFHQKMTERVRVKVEQSREATSVLHSDSVLIKGDRTRGKLHACSGKDR